MSWFDITAYVAMIFGWLFGSLKSVNLLISTASWIDNTMAVASKLDEAKCMQNATK